jgi:hypothetical protein
MPLGSRSVFASLLLNALPFVPVLGGLALSVTRFRAQDPLGGLAFGLGGLLLMVVAAIRLPDPGSGT